MKKGLGRLKSKNYFTDPKFAFRIQRHRLNMPVIRRHTHDFTELVIILAGEGTHLLGQRSHHLVPGDVFVLAGRRGHAYRDLKDLELVNILFRSDQLAFPEALLRKLPGYQGLFVLGPRLAPERGFRGQVHLEPASLEKVMGWIGEMEREMAERSPGFEATTLGLMLLMVTFLSRCYAKVRSGASGSMERLAGTLSYLEAKFNEPLVLSELAARSHLSVNQFLRVFRKATGFSPIAYQIRLRVLRAAALLRERSYRVTEAAFAVGFNDSNYFSKQFRKVMGTSPRAYRHQAPP